MERDGRSLKMLENEHPLQPGYLPACLIEVFVDGLQKEEDCIGRIPVMICRDRY